MSSSRSNSSRTNVRVVLRTRPCSSSSSSHASASSPGTLQVDAAAKTATTHDRGGGTRIGSPAPAAAGLPACPSSVMFASTPQQSQLQQQRYVFKFDGVLHESSQEEVYQTCAADMVSSALEGFSGCIIAYGQTGAGKTHTMSGAAPRSSFEQRGLIPRVLAGLLDSLRAAPGLTAWSLCLSFIEVYADGLYDLLDLSTSPGELSLYEDGAGCLQVAGARAMRVTTEAEALAVFFEGEAARVIGEHQLNRQSSRGHSIFIATTTCTRAGGDGLTTSSRLTLVDLAGSERVAKTRSEGLLLREAGQINRSLALLEQVVVAAAAVGRGQRQHVPYRSCKLTHLLRDCLGGNCVTLLLACVWGEVSQLEESLSTCRFASRMAALQVDVTRNATHSGQAADGGSARVRALQREIRHLREELALMELMSQLSQQSQQRSHEPDQAQAPGNLPAVQQENGSCRAGSQQQPAAVGRFAPYTAAQRHRLRETVLAWLQRQPQGLDFEGGGDQGDADLAPLPISSVRQLRELLLAFKGVVREVLARARGQPGGGGKQQALLLDSCAGAEWVHQLMSERDNHHQQQQQQQQQHQPQQAADVLLGGKDDDAGSLMAQAAPDHARPASYGGSSVSVSCCDADVAAGHAAAAGPGSSWPAKAAHYHDGDALPHRSKALLAYRQGPGSPTAALVNENAGRLRAAKRRRQEAAGRLNTLKARLDALSLEHEAAKQERLQRGGECEAQLLSSLEHRLLLEIRDVKAAYRDGHAELQLARDEVDYTQGVLNSCKAELAAGFEAWWAAAGAPGPSTQTCHASSRPDSTCSSSIQPLSAQGPDNEDGGGGAAAYAEARAASRVSAGAGAAALKQHRGKRSTFS